MIGPYLDHAVWVTNARNGGGTYQDGYSWRICLHTIEGGLSAGSVAGHQYPPHLWYNPATRILYQTVPLNRSAFALYQGSGPVTNKARTLQVEIAGFAAETANWPQEWRDNITKDIIVPLCQWVAANGGQIDLSNVPPVGAIGGSASEHAPQRMSYAAWNAFDGVCSHRHIPDNDHWDTGGLDVESICLHASYIIGGMLVEVPEEEEEEMPDYLIQKTDQTMMAVYPNGNVRPIMSSEYVFLNSKKVPTVSSGGAGDDQLFDRMAANAGFGK